MVCWVRLVPSEISGDFRLLRVGFLFKLLIVNWLCVFFRFPEKYFSSGWWVCRLRKPSCERKNYGAKVGRVDLFAKHCAMLLWLGVVCAMRWGGKVAPGSGIA
jgi:hypothetical protein